MNLSAAFYLLLSLLLIATQGYSQMERSAFLDNCSTLNQNAQNARFYNITASAKNQFVWFRVAKVGTRTIYQILKEHNIPISKDGYALAYNPQEYENYFKFAFCRNPWARVVSCYFNKVVTKNYAAFSECYDKNFEYFVDFIDRLNLAAADPHIRLQTKLIPLDQIDFLGSLENFEEDLTYVLNVIGLENVTIPKVNVTNHKHYSQYYTKRTANIIARKYKDDIAAFGYSFENQ